MDITICIEMVGTWTSPPGLSCRSSRNDVAPASCNLFIAAPIYQLSLPLLQRKEQGKQITEQMDLVKQIGFWMVCVPNHRQILKRISMSPCKITGAKRLSSQYMRSSSWARSRTRQGEITPLVPFQLSVFSTIICTLLPKKCTRCAGQLTSDKISFC